MNQVQLMEEILEYWRKTNAFQQSIATRSPKMPFKFYDGPPFTSGDPHYGHLLQSAVKDMVPRWMTMRGYRVERKRWWDCHGIPAENFVNKQLGITSRKQVEEEFGIKAYVEACRAMVSNVNDNRKRFVDHVGRWVDMEHAYFTMSNEFMDSVIAVFADLYHNNLIYKWFKVLGYSRALWTSLSNSEIAEGYEDRQDPAVTVKLQLHCPKINEESKYEMTEDWFVECVVGLVKDEKGRYGMIYQSESSQRFFPGGKVDKGESAFDALTREVKEEVGLNVTEGKLLGHVKIIHNDKPWRLHYFEIETTGHPHIKEPEKHAERKWIEQIPSENELWFSIKIENIIIDDVDQIKNEFIDYYLFSTGIISLPGASEGPMHLLAWTTTPRTLPANMFAAVHNDIKYVTIFDPAEKEYYILAESLLKQYYKNKEDYIVVYVCKGKSLVGLHYKPLFDYYYKAPTIDPAYHAQVHRVLHADFVTEEAGTGIAHEAPAFGEDDYALVSSILPKDTPKEWLFNPVNDYGAYTDEITDFAGMNVFDANKEVIKSLKDRGLLAKLETINHSYPHCPRTGEPLIYRALESWFVKEEELKAKTVPAAEQINFEPAAIKHRFIDTLKSAPDRNISRTRFRGAPLPVRECTKCDAREVLGSIAEIEQRSGQKVIDLHRPYIDEIMFPCACGGTMKRIPEVLDCWFESGSMPYGQDHWMKWKEQIDPKEWGQQAVKSLGFDEGGYSAILAWEKTKTYRLWDKFLNRFTKGDRVALVRSLNEQQFWVAEIQSISIISFDEIPLITSWHASYDSVQDKKIKFKHYYGKEMYDKDIITVIDFVLTLEQAWSSSLAHCEPFSPTADFIAEGLDQTRGWFRSLHVISQAYMNTIAFKNVAVTWMILAEDGKKMAKSKQNFPDPRGLLEQYGADAFRLYVLSSPVVRAEPLRFSEKGVEQVLKDFVIPLQNVWNFFETYAKVDNWKATGAEIYFMRHAEKADLEDRQKNIPLSAAGQEYLTSDGFKEQIIRLRPEVVIYSPYLRCEQTMAWVKQIVQEFGTQSVEYKSDERLEIGTSNISYLLEELQATGKRVLLISHKVVFDPLWKDQTGNIPSHLAYGEIVRLPATRITNELDQWILAELYKMLTEMDQALVGYQIEPATKALIEFVDKLTNRYVRRSRRRFRSEGMGDDKKAAYATLREVLCTYVKVAAPFAPFMTEHLRQAMQNFTARPDGGSVHLDYRPVATDKYINEQLITETETVRKIIKGAMYLRAKNKIKVKQPLLKLEVKI